MIARLQIAVQKRAKLPAINRRLEAVSRFQEMAQLDRDPDRTFGRQRPVGDDLRKVPAFEVLHRDVEISAFGVVFVHDWNVAAGATQLLLQLRAPALGFHDFVCFPVGSNRHELERNLAAVPAVGRQKDDGHSAAADFVDNFVRSNANALKDRRHHRPRRPRDGCDVVHRGS